MSEKEGIPIFEVWKKYENIAMHFNDLLIKLRTQAIGGVAAIATIVVVISKNANSLEFNWAIMASVFFFLNIFWVAVWILDFTYYNRLLLGAVDALLEIEKKSKTETTIKELNLSKKVENAVAGVGVKIDQQLHCKLSFGRRWFYLVVFVGLITGFSVSLFKYMCN